MQGVAVRALPGGGKPDSLEENAELREVATPDLHPGLTSNKEVKCLQMAALADMATL